MFSKVILLVILAIVASVAAQSTGKLYFNYLPYNLLCSVYNHQTGNIVTNIKQ